MKQEVAGKENSGCLLGMTLGKFTSLFLQCSLVYCFSRVARRHESSKRMNFVRASIELRDALPLLEGKEQTTKAKELVSKLLKNEEGRVRFSADDGRIAISLGVEVAKFRKSKRSQSGGGEKIRGEIDFQQGGYDFLTGASINEKEFIPRIRLEDKTTVFSELVLLENGKLGTVKIVEKETIRDYTETDYYDRKRGKANPKPSARMLIPHIVAAQKQTPELNLLDLDEVYEAILASKLEPSE